MPTQVTFYPIFSIKRREKERVLELEARTMMSKLVYMFRNNRGGKLIVVAEQ